MSASDPAGIRRAGEAVEDARAAAASAGIEVRPMDGIVGAAAIGPFLRAIWAREENPVPQDLVIALTHAGNYATGAYADGALIGALIGFTGVGGGLHLHSHILGVVPAARARGVGFALKLDQRAWALRNGMTTISWTTDPLVRRNVHFNINKLGAVAPAYVRNMYGSMRDSENAGEESDRIVVEWRVDQPLTTVAPATVPTTGAVVLAVGADGEPVATPAPPGAPVLLCAVPEDIVAVRRGDAGRAHRWRLALREVLEGALESGYRLDGVTPGGAYALSAP